VLRVLPDGAEGWLAAAVYLEAATRAWVDGGW